MGWIEARKKCESLGAALLSLDHRPEVAQLVRLVRSVMVVGMVRMVRSVMVWGRLTGCLCNKRETVQLNDVSRHNVARRCSANTAVIDPLVEGDL